MFLAPFFGLRQNLVQATYSFSIILRTHTGVHDGFSPVTVKTVEYVSVSGRLR